jgi:methionyl-tRNA formyltransferase
MLNTASVPIDDQTTTAELHDQMAKIGGPLLVHSLKRLDQGTIEPIQQPHDEVTYAHKITTNDACIRWDRDHNQVMRQIHAFNPVPGAFTFAGSSRIKIYSVRAATGDTPQAGMLWKENDKILVSTRNGNLEILECQLPGGKRLMLEQMLSHQSAPWIEPTQLLEQGA